MTDQINTHFTFHPIDNIDTKRMIKNVKLSNSKGHDGLSSEVLKLISNEISSSITVIINQTLTTGIFPDKLKIAKVVPILRRIVRKNFKITDLYQYYLSYPKYLNR